ncbi:class I SAM-dependent methyltransferase [Ideonella paludis]|uniref:SAM-dependent methyltransferase n=1 Tax=Ideonella paludis TaxID=1233411 RepID=A0ABS5DT61_9BURK|nr:SAM-dependent methyltransferase [Ideonella paludis]MBQ0934332.1 SAM-dependent methyltransferase [Ideonella paludis]
MTAHDPSSPSTPSPSATSHVGDQTEALADLARRERFFEAVSQSLESGRFKRLLLSKPRSGGPAVAEQLQRVDVKRVQIKGQACLSLLYQHKTRDITKNPPLAEALVQLQTLVGDSFSHAHLFTRDETLQLLISKRGKVALQRSRVEPHDDEADKTALDEGALQDDAASSDAGDEDDDRIGHARQKQHLVKQSEPFLQALGVTDKSGQLVPAMARKWRQINKFVEVLDHAVDEAGLLATPGRELHMVDFGAGKGYLTFAAHQHLQRQHHLRLRTSGVELREGLVAQTNQIARGLKLAGLEFVCGDVRSVVPERIDVMIALHACDVATDYALHTGIRAQAAVIISSPCCHKELRPQMVAPATLKALLSHGIHQSQQAEMLTDTLRALLLESQGYKTKVFEFISPEATSKNKMILALRRTVGTSTTQAAAEAKRREQAWQEAESLMREFGIRKQCLRGLLEAAVSGQH